MRKQSSLFVRTRPTSVTPPHARLPHAGGMVRLCWQRRRSTAPIISSLKARLQRRGAGVSAAPRDSETNPWSSMVCFLKRRSAMLRFLLGPFVALLPKRWRCSLALLPSADWRVPSILSGLAEFLVAVAAMLYWYSYSVTTWVSRGLELALAGKAGPGVNEQEIGFMAIFIFATHPLTWLRGPSAAEQGGYTEGNLSSYVGAIREKLRVSLTAGIPDELCVSTEGAEGFLEIRASRRKPDWTPPRTVKYQDTFYRLEDSSTGWAPRPYRYRLRRLSAGVMSRTVL